MLDIPLTVTFASASSVVPEIKSRGTVTVLPSAGVVIFTTGGVVSGGLGIAFTFPA